VRRVSKRWDLRRFDARILAEALASHPSVGFPVNLSALASRCRVKDIRFRPLIVDGALGVSSDGFEIFVRCKSFEIEELNDLFNSSPNGSELPRSIIHKARFTIAHELAHTLFYDRKVTPPKRKFRVSTHKEATTLEHACNTTAAAFLLPKEALRKYFGNADFRDPKTLAMIAAKALVAKSVVIMRIPDVDSALQPCAILATARSNKGKLQIENVWRHYSFVSRFPKLKREASFSTAFNDAEELLDLRILGGYCDEVNFEVPFGRRVETWTLSVEPGASASSGKSFLISIFRPEDFP
jgi:hypothetical protein